MNGFGLAFLLLVIKNKNLTFKKTQLCTFDLIQVESESKFAFYTTIACLDYFCQLRCCVRTSRIFNAWIFTMCNH